MTRSAASLALALLPAVLAAALAQPAAQPLRVYSEFRRLDPFGNLLEPEFRPREILSPGLARNGWSSFRIAVSVPAGTAYTLYVGQNPEASFPLTVYRERYANRNGRWAPVLLERVELPYQGRMPEPGAGVEGQTTQTFWMDLWVGGGLRVERYKVEPELDIKGQWIVYPMEVRVVAAEIPNAAAGPAPSFREFFCGQREIPASIGTPEFFSQRNRAQDVRLARKLEGQRGKLLFGAQVARRLGSSEPKVWCGAPPPADPEWFLPVRDFLLRGPGFH